MKKLVPMLLSGAAITSSLMGVSSVSAATSSQKDGEHVSLRGHAMMTHKGTGVMPKHAVFGEVTAVNGDSVTVKSKNGVEYIVDVANAKIMKGYGSSATELRAADIAVGDSLSAMGTIIGTSVAAKNVIDGNGVGQWSGKSRKDIVPGITHTMRAHGSLRKGGKHFLKKAQ